jgi:hypothetical protein
MPADFFRADPCAAMRHRSEDQKEDQCPFKAKKGGVAKTFLSVQEQTEMSVPPQNQCLKKY